MLLGGGQFDDQLLDLLLLLSSRPKFSSGWDPGLFDQISFWGGIHPWLAVQALDNVYFGIVVKNYFSFLLSSLI